MIEVLEGPRGPRGPLKPEIMLIEWQQKGKWFGSTDEKRVGKFRSRAERYLMESANPYFYPEEYQGAIRLSYPNK